MSMYGCRSKRIRIIRRSKWRKIIQMIIVEGTEGPPLGTRGGEENSITILWDPGIPKRNTMIDRKKPLPLSWRKAMDYVVNV